MRPHVIRRLKQQISPLRNTFPISGEEVPLSGIRDEETFCVEGQLVGIAGGGEEERAVGEGILAEAVVGGVEGPAVGGGGGGIAWGVNLGWLDADAVGADARIALRM